MLIAAYDLALGAVIVAHNVHEFGQVIVFLIDIRTSYIKPILKLLHI